MKRRRPVQVKKSLNIKSILTLTAAFVLVAALSIGGTLAWLTDTTNEVKNTFTVGNIDIELAETTTNYKMVPSKTISKDPKVTVKAGSEACWVFVKIEESNNLDSFITYEIAEGWTELENNSGIYYREQGDLTAETAADAVYSVLKDDQVKVNSDVTKAQMDNLEKEDAEQPTLTFTAYAIQKEGVTSAADAWSKLNPTTDAGEGA